jgi:hypothetical protein
MEQEGRNGNKGERRKLSEDEVLEFWVLFDEEQACS